MATYEIWNLAEKNQILNLKDDYKASQVQNYMSQYFISDESINYIKQQIKKEIVNGLKNSDATTVQDPTVLGMKVTFYTELFDGTENGKYVVMYLNRRHLLLILAKIKPGFPVKVRKEYFMVSENIRRSPYIKIFEFLCECLLKFFSTHDLLGSVQTVGFCSDLPLIQFGIDRCMVWYFTPSAADFPLNCYDVKRCFDIALLKERYRDLKIDLVAILNNNSGMLIRSSYVCGQLDVLLNLATECDILYWEEVANVEKWKTKKDFEKVLIATELRNFGGNGCLDFIPTELEWSSVITTDKHAKIERFVSQQYILELIKHILIDLHHELLYCRYCGIGNLQRDGIRLDDLCAFANCDDMQHAAVLLPGGIIGGSQEDAKVAKYVCTVVMVRAAILTAVCMSSLLLSSPKDDLVIAANCPLLEKHRDFDTYVRNVVKWFTPEKKFKFVWTEESMVCEGAALATSIAKRLDRTDLRF